MTVADTETVLRSGDRIEVRNRFTGEFGPGFVVVESDEGGVLVRRVRDGIVLPVRFKAADVRHEGASQHPRASAPEARLTTVDDNPGA